MLWQGNRFLNAKALSKLTAISLIAIALVGCKPGGGPDDGDDDCDSSSSSHSEHRDDDGKHHSRYEKKLISNNSGKKQCDNPTPNPPPTPNPYPFPNDPNKVCKIEKFKQTSTTPVLKKVDILFVMDTSGSMGPDWERVAKNVKYLVQELPSDTDIRYAVLLGHAGNFSGKLYAKKNEPLVLNNQTMDVKKIAQSLQVTFASAMNESDPGNGESLFYSLQNAVTTEVNNNKKAGFFRSDAALSILFMSDENEIGTAIPNPQAPGLPPDCDAANEAKVRDTYYVKKGVNNDTVYAAVKKLKGDKPVLMSAMVNLTINDIRKSYPAHMPKCTNETLGYGYISMVDRAHGLLYSIMDDRAKGLAKIGSNIRESLNIVHDFPLAWAAKDVDAKTIMAAVDGSLVAHSYKADVNTVHLDDAGGAGSMVEIRYCKPEVIPTWEVANFKGVPSEYYVSLSWDTQSVITSGKILWGTDFDNLSNEINSGSNATGHSVIVNNLQPDTIYYFQAVSKDKYGVEKRSAILDVKTIAVVPPPPTEWNLINFNGVPAQNSVNLSFETPEYATTGKILWGNAADNLSNQVDDSGVKNNHAVVVNGLSANTSYFFQAVANDDQGIEKRSAVIEVKTLAQPPKVWNITEFGGVAAQNAVTLSWKTTEFATTGTVRYGKAADALNDQLAEVGPSTVHSMEVSGLTADTVYYFQVTAVDSDGQSKQSEVISVKTLPEPPKPWTLVGFSGIAAQNVVNLSWSTPEVATSGKILWGTAANALINVVDEAGVNNDHSVVVSGLTPDTVYFFQAVSTDNHGQSKASAVIQVKTLPIPLPVWSLTNFAGAASQNSVALTWNTSEYATNGKIKWGTSAGALDNEVSEVAATTDHAVTVAGLTADTVYYFQAVSTDDRGQSKSSAVIQVKTTAIPLPVWNLTGFAGTSTQTTVDLVWNTAEYTTSGKIKWGTSAGSLVNVVNEATSNTNHAVTVSGLTADTVYYFQAVSTDDRGQVKSSDVIQVKTQPVPLPVWTLTNFAGSAAKNSVDLSWMTSEYATSGKILWGTSSGALVNTANEAGSNTSHAVTVSGLTANTTYYFQAVSTDDRGQVKSSPVIAITTLADTIPAWTVAGFDGTTATNSATMIWQTQTVSTRAVLRVGLSETDLSFMTIDVPNFSATHVVTVNGLDANTTYYFQVEAFDANGTSHVSGVIFKKTKP